MITRRVLIFLAIGLAVIVVVALVARTLLSSTPSGLDTARSKMTLQNLYRVAIEPEGGSFAQNEMHTWLMTITSDEQPVVGATIRVFGGMPQHGHGLPTQPQATEIGAGRYRVQGVKFNMAGWWELKFQITAPQGTDDVVFNITL